MELSDSGKVRKRYIRGIDLIYADKGIDSTSEKQYYIKNPHGDVVQLTDESGKIIKTYEYDSFGNEVNPNTKDENPFRYCGEYFDKETDSIYLRARYYQAYLGRFLTRDTYTGEADDPLSLHLYTYCGNDGVNRIDPSGNVFETILDIASIGHSIYCLVTEPSWENAAYLAWDIGATVVPGAPGSYVGKAGKAISKVTKSSKAVQKGAKYAKKAKTAVSGAKTVGKRVVKKSAKAIKKRVKLNGKNLPSRTKRALDKRAKSKYRNATKNSFVISNKGENVRKVDFFHALNGHAKNKHLLGDSKYSLKKLDPKGNVDKWIEELNKLATSGKGTYKKMSNGTKLRIDGKMKKTGGGGYIKIGVDLFKKDGAKKWTVSTIRTKQ